MKLTLSTNNGLVIEVWEDIEERICGVPDRDIVHDLNRSVGLATLRGDVKVVHSRKHDDDLDMDYVSWKEVPVTCPKCDLPMGACNCVSIKDGKLSVKQPYGERKL